MTARVVDAHEALVSIDGREDLPVAVGDEESARRLPVPRADGRPPVPLASVADVEIVEGPASVKGENGLLRNYVRLNVRGRDAGEFVEEGQRAWPRGWNCRRASTSSGPGGSSTRTAPGGRWCSCSWPRSGLIAVLLYLTFRDWRTPCCCCWRCRGRWPAG